MKKILIILNLVIFFVIFISLDKNIEENKNEMILKITDLSNLTAIKISKQNDIIILKKTNDYDWIIKTPVERNADHFALSNFITIFTHLKLESLYEYDELLKRGEMLKDYGIDNNSTQIELTKDDLWVTIKIGNKTRDNKSIFCAIKDNDDKDFSIWRISTELNNLVNTPFMEWADSKLINSSLYKIDSITSTFKSNNGTETETTLLKNNNDWHFVKPFTAKANNEDVRLLLNKLLTEEIVDLSSYKDSNKTSGNLENSWVIKLEIKSIEKTHIYYMSELINLETGKYRLCKSNFGDDVFKINNAFVSTLSDWSTKLRERKVIDINADQIKKISLHNKRHKFEVNNEVANNWLVTEDNNHSYAGDNEDIFNLIKNLNNIEAKEFISFNQSESGILLNNKDENNFTIKIGKKDGTSKTILIQINENDATLWKTYMVEDSLLCLVEDDWNSILNKEPYEYKNRNILLPGEEISEIELIDLESNNTVVLVENNDETKDLFTGSFRVDKYINNRSDNDGTWKDGDWVPWNYKLKVFIESENATEFKISKIIYLTEQLNDNYWFGSLQDDNLTFNISSNFAKIINPIIKK